MVSFNLDVPEATYIPDDRTAKKLLMKLLRKIDEDPTDFIGLDTETHGKKIPLKMTKTGRLQKTNPLDWLQDTVIFWSLSTRFHGNGSEQRYERYCLQAQHLYTFIPLLENRKTNFALWNLKYDAHVLYNSGIDIWEANSMDFLVGGALVDENMQGSMGLKESAPRGFSGYTKHTQRLLDSGVVQPWKPIYMTKFSDIFGNKDDKGNKIEEFETSLFNLPREKVANYASLDAYATLLLAEHIQELLINTAIDDDYTMWDHFINMEVPFTEVLWRMERRGLGIDKLYLKSLTGPIEKELTSIHAQINQAAGWFVDINKTAHLQRLFFGPKDSGGFELQPIKMTKGGAKLPTASTDDSVLEIIANHFKGEPKLIAGLIRRYRSVAKIKSTYVTALLKLAQYFPDGRAHPSFNQTGARTGRLSTTNPNCFDRETEVLTRAGWVRFDALERGTPVAQWSPDGVIKFVVPTNYTKEHYTGEMVHVRNQHIDLLMTPNHRCPLQDRKNGNLITVPAEKYKEDYRQLHGGEFTGSGAFDVSKDEIRLLLATQADGSWHDGGIDFTFKKDRKARRLKATLEATDTPFSYKFNPGGPRRHRFRVKVSAMAKWLYEVLGPEKKFGPWILDLSKANLQFFCKEVFFWDGHFAGDSMYASSLEANTSWVQIALTLCGARAKVRVYRPSNPKARLSYQIDHTPRNYSLTTNVSNERVQWDDEVFCVTVPSGFILVRRNGRVCVSGNSQNQPRPDADEFKIRRAFIPRKGRILIVADYEQLEMRIMADRSQDEGMLEAIRNGLDLHCVTVQKMYGIPYNDVAKAKKIGKIDENNPITQIMLMDFVALGEKGPSLLADLAQKHLNGEDSFDEIAKLIKKLIRLRQEAKVTGFALIYGAGAMNISLQLECTKEEAQEKIDAYFQAFPRVKELMNRLVSECEVDEFVTTLVGRRRHLPDINSHTWSKKGHAQRECVNAPIQGTASDMAKAAMISIENDPELRERDFELINQVHDEVIGECPIEHAEFCRLRVKYHMENCFNGQPALSVPTPADAKAVLSWDQAK